MSAEPQRSARSQGRRVLVGLVWTAVTVALLWLVEAALSPSGLFGYGFPSYWGRILVLAGINVTLAVSLNLVNGFTGQFSIGHAGFMAIGAYVAAYLTVYHGAAWTQALAGIVGQTIAPHLMFTLAVIVAAAAGALAGVFVGIPSLRLTGDYLAIVTLGFAEIIRIVLVNIDKVGGATGFTVGGYSVGFVWVGGLAVLTILVTRNLVASATGRAFIAIREDELAAKAMGVDATRYKVLAFSVSSAFAAIAGALFGHYTQFLSTNDFQFIRSFEVIIMIVLGGMGSITGAVFGAFVVTLLPELLREFASWRLVIYSAMLILIMIFRPQGILGHREISPRRWLARWRRKTA